MDWIALGTVNGDPGVRARAHIFAGSMACWHEIADDLPEFEEWPSETSEFFEKFG